MSLRARLLVLALVATLLPALLLGWRFVHDSEAAIAASVRTLARAADNIAADLDHRVQGTAQLHFGLAHARVLDSSERGDCSRYLSDVREAYPQYTGIVSVRPDGQLHCDSLNSGRQLNLADRGYFKRVMAGSDGSLTLEPVFGRLTGNSVLQIVYPARHDGGALRFMLVASLNLQTFTQGHHRRLAAPAPEVLLVDRHGTVMAWSGSRADLPVPGSSIAGSSVFTMAQAKAGGGTGELIDASGQAQVWAVAAPGGQATGLHVLMGLPRAQLVASAEQRLRADLLVLAAAALVLFAGVWLLAESGIRRPVGRITTMVRALGDGHLGARIEPPYARGELGGLMAALNSTAASLQQQRDAIDQLGLRLRHAQKLEAIGTLAGGIAHDFNNILGAILGNLALAEDDAREGRPGDGSLAQIRRAAVRGRDLVQRIQAFSRPDTPALVAQPLRAIVDEVLALLQPTLPADVTLQRELSRAECRVNADSTQLHQVLMNLCTNAWQALQGEPGSLTVGLQALQLGDDAAARPAGLAAGRYARLWVQDSGSGIAPDVRERIFEPYFTTKGGHGGTGLGLSVVHGIVKAHGGAIVVDSTPGRGSTFTLFLPLLDDAAPMASAVAAGVPAATAAHIDVRGRAQHVLCIDDDEVMGLMVERLLERAGYRVSFHQHAAAALAALHKDTDSFDVVVSDFNMPDLSGLEVCRAIEAQRADMPMIIVTGYVHPDLPAQARELGVHELVLKQNVFEDLVPAVARALATARQPSAAPA